MAERSHDWMAQAERDLLQARSSVEGGFFEWACFIAQQAAEKAVKALFQRIHGEAWGHAVSGLLKSLPSELMCDRELLDKAIVLDRYYIPARYPNGFERGAPMDYFTRADAEEAVAFASEIIAYCKGHLS